MLEATRQDVQFAIRNLRRDKGLAIFAILIAGLGVGASTTVFSVVNALLLRALPFQDPARLVWIANDHSEGLSGRTIQVGHAVDYGEQTQSFSGVAAYFAFYGVGDAKLTGIGEPERLTAVPVSENFFPLLGVQPIHGRNFSADECRWNGPRAALLSDGFWRRKFQSDPGVVGRSLTINDQPTTVVGVLPASFDFGAVFAPGRRVDVYTAFPLTQETNRWGNTLSMIGRLKPGVTLQAAQAEGRVLSDRLSKQNPNRNDLILDMKALRDHITGPFRTAMFFLSGAVGLVMLIVCANLSNLLLARSATREKEMAIRAALGAGRGRLVRQLLTESLVLSCSGALLGLLLAFAGTRAVTSLEAISIPLLADVRLDIPALVVTLVLAIVTGIGFGLMPAIRLPALSLHNSLKDSSRGSSEGRSHGWTRSVLIVGEITLACVLVAGAGLLIRSFTRVLQVELGFHPENAIAIRIDPSSQYSTQVLRNSYFDEALRKILSTPGVQAAGLTDCLPLGRNRSWGIRVKGKTFPRGQNPSPFVRIISDGYFRAMGIPLRAGRDFTAADRPESEPVIIVNETLARLAWPGEDPIGKIIRADRPERRVVGVVQDVRHLALEKGAGAEMYLPIRQTNDYASVDVVVRGALPAGGLASSTRVALASLDPTLPANEFRPLQGLVDRSISPRRFLVILLAGFALFALGLAALGIYGVILYSVTQRRREIGIRMALGATAGEVQRNVLLQTLRLASAGVALGVAASWVLGRLIQGLLYDVTPSDPMTFAAMLAILLSAAALAGYIPARRAARIDPMEALRAE